MGFVFKIFVLTFLIVKQYKQLGGLIDDEFAVNEKVFVKTLNVINPDNSVASDITQKYIRQGGYFSFIAVVCS